MGSVASVLPLTAVLVPVVTAIVVVATRRQPNLRDISLFIGALVTFVVVAAMVPSVLSGDVPTSSLGELIPGFALSLRADGFGMVFALLASLLWVLASSYAVGYMRGGSERNQTRFYAFYALCLATAFGVAFAGDLITFFIFYELLTASTYPLVTHKGNDEAVRAGRKYLGFLLAGGVAVLLGTVMIVQTTGQTAFVAGGFVSELSPLLTAIAFTLFAVGFGTKAGLMPLHAWLPAAMVAPTPVSALLHAVAVVKAGVFAFGRLIGFTFGPATLASVGPAAVLAIVAGTTILVASVIALRQDHLKRRLAYSTIAHLAYIVLGFALLAPTAFEGAILHMVNHGALKITLFFCAGAIYIHRKYDRVSQLDGIGRQMPFTMGAFAIASLGLAGLPPMGGFSSKWHLVLGAYEGGHVFYASLMVGAGLLTAAYLFPIVHRAFFRPAPTAGSDIDEGADLAIATRTSHGWTDASPLMVIPLVTTALLGLLLGLGDLFSISDLAGRIATAVSGGAT